MDSQNVKSAETQQGRRCGCAVRSGWKTILYRRTAVNQNAFPHDPAKEARIRVQLSRRRRCSCGCKAAGCFLLCFSCRAAGDPAW